jgi:hypothetical protein
MLLSIFGFAPLGRCPLDEANVCRFGPAGSTGDDVVLHHVALTQGTKPRLHDGTYMHEGIAGTVAAADEAVPLIAKHLDRSP